MPSYVWTRYDCPSPVFSQVKSNEVKFKRTGHGSKPSDDDVASTRPSLISNVGAAYATYNKNRPVAQQVAAPSDQTIWNDKKVHYQDRS